MPALKGFHKFLDAYIILKFSPKILLDKPYFYLSIATIIAIISGLMPYGRILSIQRTLNFFPMFLLGYFMRLGVIKQKLWSNGISFGISALCIVLVFFEVITISVDEVKIVLRGAGQYSPMIIPIKTLYLTISFFLSISVLSIIPKNKILAHFGRNSIFYYLYHGLIIRFILKPVVDLCQLPQDILFMLVYFTCVVGIIFVLEKIRTFKWLTNPLSSNIK